MMFNAFHCTMLFMGMGFSPGDLVTNRHTLIIDEEFKLGGVNVTRNESRSVSLHAASSRSIPAGFPVIVISPTWGGLHDLMVVLVGNDPVCIWSNQALLAARADQAQ